MKSTDTPQLRLFVRLLRVIARLCGVNGKRYNELIACYDRMTPEQREAKFSENLRTIAEHHGKGLKNL